MMGKYTQKPGVDHILDVASLTNFVRPGFLESRGDNYWATSCTDACQHLCLGDCHLLTTSVGHTSRNSIAWTQTRFMIYYNGFL